jgi:hypothetical protein
VGRNPDEDGLLFMFGMPWGGGPITPLRHNVPGKPLAERSRLVRTTMLQRGDTASLEARQHRRAPFTLILIGLVESCGPAR